MSWAFMSLPWEQYKPSLRQHQPRMTPFTPSYQKNKQQECLILDLTNLTSQTTIIKSLPNWAPCICTSLRLINRLSVRYEGILDLPNTWVAPARQAKPHQIQTLSSTWVVELKMYWLCIWPTLSTNYRGFKIYISSVHASLKRLSYTN